MTSFHLTIIMKTMWQKENVRDEGRNYMSSTLVKKNNNDKEKIKNIGN